jgi:hypothetical protein
MGPAACSGDHNAFSLLAVASAAIFKRGKWKQKVV